MKEEEFKPIAKSLLERLGLKVLDIPSKEECLTPDFEAIGERDNYTIELKIKGDEQEEISKEDEALSRGELVTKSIPLGPRNTLGGIIRKGVRQMLEHDPEGTTFRVIWLHASGQDPCLHNERFRSTLFGMEHLVSLRLPNIVTCYYFHESAFFSWRDYLDGAILTYLKNGQSSISTQLCVNSLSGRVEEFRKSELVVRLSEGLCDPQNLAESDKHIMIADCDIDRKKEDEVLAYLKGRHGLDHLQTIPMQQLTGMVRLPLDDNSQVNNSP